MLTQKKILLQLTLGVCFWLILVEGLVFWGSISSRQETLKDLERTLRFRVVSNQENFLKDPLPQTYIDKNVQQFKRNMLLITLLIVVVTVLGTLLVYYYFIGRYLNQLLSLNRTTQAQEVKMYPEEFLPDNELREILLARNDMLQKLLTYQDSVNKQLEDTKTQLFHSAKMSVVGEMTAAVAHDLNNSLTVTLGNLKILRKLLTKSLPEETKIFQRLDRLDHSAEQIKQLIGHMNTFHEAEFNPQAGTAVFPVIQDCLLLLDMKIKKHKIKIVNFCRDEDLLCFADPTALRQVVVNLLTNAVEAMTDSEEESEKKVVTIDATDDDDFVNILISDTGVGIPMENRAHIFNAFFTTKKMERGHGLGLGLSIVAQIIDGHSGMIHMESEVGSGTQFTIQLPKEDPDGEQQDQDQVSA